MSANSAKPRAPKAVLSPVTATSALGGLLLIAGFFAPLYGDDGGAEDSPIAEFMRDFETKLGSARDERDALPPEYVATIDSAAEHAAALVATPSPKNLAWISADAIDLLAIVELTSPELAAEVQGTKAVLRGLLVILLGMPLIGAYEAIRGLKTRFRKHGTLGLTLCFFAGFFYLGIGTVAISSVPARMQDLIGPACWLLTAGGGLLLSTSIFGVSRTTWWRAYLLYIAGLVALGAAAYSITSGLH